MNVQTHNGEPLNKPVRTGAASGTLELSIALMNTPLVRPIIEGRVAPQGIRLIPTAIHASEIFWRQLKFADFDVSEMSMSSLLIATSRGDRRWVALPIFTMRRFFHTWCLVRADSGITRPEDLRGKRVGVPEYQQTAAIWSRGVLQHEFDVHPREIEWFMERPPSKSHGGATGFVPPEGVRLNQIPPETNIGQMLVRGELDATLLYLAEKNLVDRSTVDLSGVVRPLFPDAEAETRRYYAKTGIYPTNHVVAMRRELLESHPWVALNLYTAFLEAKRELLQTRDDMLTPYFELGLLGSETKDVLRNDPTAYGLRAGRTMLETIAQYLEEQGLTPRRVGLDEVFAPSTLDL
jgi:4,5-dihydroxyphthalate decarboxylase